MKSPRADSIDEYINRFPDEVRKKLETIRETVRKAAPGATEAIKYAMPTFTMKKNLVHFAAFKHHIDFYPAPRASGSLQKFHGTKARKEPYNSRWMSRFP